jgi:hypothetical protein
MSVRLAALGVPRFRVHDLELNENWLPVESVTEKQRSSLVAHVGRYVHVHPGDIEKLGELGLAQERTTVMVDGKPEADKDGKPTGRTELTGRVVEAKKSTPKPAGGAPDTTGKAGAKKES